MAPVENVPPAVSELQRQLARALIIIDRLERENAALKARVAELEEKLKTDSFQLLEAAVERPAIETEEEAQEEGQAQAGRSAG